MDNDNDTDVIAIGYTSNEIAWFENRLQDPNHLIKPECVVYDYAQQRYLVACYGKGAIVELDTAGNQSFFYTDVNTPMGMVINDNILYVSDDDTLRGIDLYTKQEVMSLRIPALQNIDGMAVDSSDYLYVVDTYGRIFKVNTITHGFSELVGTGLLPMYTQDIVYDQFHHRLVVAAWEANASIYAVNLSDSTVSELATNTPGYYDGITMDHEGFFYLASHDGGRIFKYDPEFIDPPEIISTGHQEPAGLNYNISDHMLAVPNFGGNSVDFLFLGPTAIAEPSMGNSEILLYPNPAAGSFMIKTQDASPKIQNLKIYDISGQEVNGYEATDNYFKVKGLGAGMYFVRMELEDDIVIRKLIVNK
jgi:hypothetical protein